MQEPEHGAISADGRTFTCWLPLDSGFLAGDLVVVRPVNGPAMLGQLLVSQVHGSTASCDGRLLATIGPDGLSGVVPRPFGTGAVEHAGLDVLAEFNRMSGADLAVGTRRTDGVEAPALLRTGGFNRHTFLCGQSGSGKTYALGVVLERLLARTELRMIIVDPNADFVRLDDVRPDAAGQEAERLRAADVRVLRSGLDDDPAAGEPLTVAFGSLSAAAKAATLQVDPLRDRDEFNALLQVMSGTPGSADMSAYLEETFASDLPVRRALAQRIENLGLVDLSVWSRGRETVLDAVDAKPRALVLDVAGFSDSRERSIAALALLDHLWTERTKRDPVLLVLDEAHNLCTSEPEDALQAAVTARLVQIAAEGRKYGIWLLLSTQRPSKIHPNVLSQCDNLLLMRMNSPGDLAELATVFGSVPPAMLSVSATFRQGEILLAGGFVPTPTFARVGERLTFQGGSDVDVPRDS